MSKEMQLCQWAIYVLSSDPFRLLLVVFKPPFVLAETSLIASVCYLYTRISFCVCSTYLIENCLLNTVIVRRSLRRRRNLLYLNLAQDVCTACLRILLVLQRYGCREDLVCWRIAITLGAILHLFISIGIKLRTVGIQNIFHYYEFSENRRKYNCVIFSFFLFPFY